MIIAQWKTTPTSKQTTREKQFKHFKLRIFYESKTQTAKISFMDLLICSSEENLQAQSLAGGSSSSSSTGPRDWSLGRMHLSCITSEMSVKEPKCCSRCWAHRTGTRAEILILENQKRLSLWIWWGHHFASCAQAAEKLQYSTALSFITSFPESFFSVWWSKAAFFTNTGDLSYGMINSWSTM